MIKPEKKESVVFFTNPSLKRPKKWVSAIMALVLLLTICQPLEARPGNHGEYSTGEMFALGFLAGAITDVIIILGNGGPVSYAAAAGSVASQLVGLYMYYYVYDSSGETVCSFEIFGTEVEISRGAFWSMVAGVTVGCAVGWAAAAAGAGAGAMSGAGSGAASGTAPAATTTIVTRVVNAVIELAKKLTIGFVVMCIQKWWEEYLVQKHGVKRLWAQTATSIANLAVSILGGLLVKKVKNATVSEDGKQLTINKGVNKDRTPIDGKSYKVKSAYSEGSAKGKPEIVLDNQGNSFKTQTDALGNITGLKSMGTGTTIATIALDIVSVATGNGITALVQKAVGGVFKLFGINKVFTGYGQVKEKAEVDTKTEVFNATAKAVAEGKEKALNSPESVKQIRSDLLAEADKTQNDNPKLAAEMREMAINTAGQIDIKQAAALIDRANVGLGEKSGLVKPGNPFLARLGISTGSNYLDNKILVEAAKKDSSLTGRLQALSNWYTVTGGIPQYQSMPLHEAILGEVLSRGYAGALKQVARTGILDLLDYRKYHGRNKQKNYENLVKMIIAESGANLITGMTQMGMSGIGQEKGQLNTNSFLKLALKETGSGLAQIGLARWTRDWDLHPQLKGVVQLAGASVAGAAFDAAFRRGEGEDSKLTFGSFARGTAENFNNYFTKTAIDVALMPPLLTVSGLDPATAQNEYEKYQDRLIGYYKSMAEANYGGRTVDFTSVFMDDVSQKMLLNAGTDLGESLADSGARLLNKAGTNIDTQNVMFKPWARVSAEQTARLETQKKGVEKTKNEIALTQRLRGDSKQNGSRYHLNLDVSLTKENKEKDKSVDLNSQEASERAGYKPRRYSLTPMLSDQEVKVSLTEMARLGQGPILMQNRFDTDELIAARPDVIKSLDTQIESLDKQISTRKSAEKFVTYLGWVPVIGAFAMGAAGGAEGYAERGYGVLSDAVKGGIIDYTTKKAQGGKETTYYSEVAGIAQPIETYRDQKNDEQVDYLDKKTGEQITFKKGNDGYFRRTDGEWRSVAVEDPKYLEQIRQSQGWESVSKSGLVERTTVDNFGRPIHTDYYNGQGSKEDKVTDYYGPYSADFAITKDYTKIDPGNWSTKDEKREVSPEKTKPPSFKEIKLLTDALYGFDKRKLNPKALEELKKNPEFLKLVEYAKAHPEAVINVEGYTDRVGTDKYNKVLGQDRGNGIEGVLRGLDISNPINVQSNGEEKATVPLVIGGRYSTDKEREIDRRIEVGVNEQKEIPGEKIPAVFQTVAVDKPQSFDANVTYKIGDAYTGTPGLSVEAAYIGSGPQLITKGDQPNNLSALYEGITRVNGTPVSYTSSREEIMEQAMQKAQ